MGWAVGGADAGHRHPSGFLQANDWEFDMTQQQQEAALAQGADSPEAGAQAGDKARDEARDEARDKAHDKARDEGGVQAAAGITYFRANTDGTDGSPTGATR